MSGEDGTGFIMGWGSVAGSDILLEMHDLIQEPRFRQPYYPLNKVKKSQIWHFLGLQVFGEAPIIFISQATREMAYWCRRFTRSFLHQPQGHSTS